MAKSRPIPGSVLDRSPSHLLHRAVQLALDIYGEEVGAASVTQRQYAVLCAVAADEGLSQTGLVRATGIDRSTLADMVTRMIAKGLLVRARSTTDARTNTVNLSEEGRLALDAALPKVLAADHRLLGLLGPKKRDAFVDALRKLSKAGEAALFPVAPAEDQDGAPETVDRPDKPRKAKRASKAERPHKKKGKDRLKTGKPAPLVDEAPDAIP